MFTYTSCAHFYFISNDIGCKNQFNNILFHDQCQQTWNKTSYKLTEEIKTDIQWKWHQETIVYMCEHVVLFLHCIAFATLARCYSLCSSSVSNVHTYQFSLFVYFRLGFSRVHFFFPIRLRIILGRTKVMVMLCLSLFDRVFFSSSFSLLHPIHVCVLKTVIIATTPNSPLNFAREKLDKWKVKNCRTFPSLIFIGWFNGCCAEIYGRPEMQALQTAEHRASQVGA